MLHGQKAAMLTDRGRIQIHGHGVGALWSHTHWWGHLVLEGSQWAVDVLRAPSLIRRRVPRWVTRRVTPGVISLLLILIPHHERGIYEVVGRWLLRFTPHVSLHLFMRGRCVGGMSVGAISLGSG